MKLPRNLSGQELADHLCRRWDYLQVNQVGSHIVIQTQSPVPHRIVVPAHKSLRIGTLNGILRDVARHKNEDKDVILDGIREGPKQNRLVISERAAQGRFVPGNAARVCIAMNEEQGRFPLQ